VALLSDLLTRVHDEFPSVPEQVALRALSDSVKEFCRRTHVWQEDLPTVRTRAGASEYELSPDDGVVIVALKEVRLKATGERVPPYATELKRMLVTPISAGKTLGYVQRRPTTIELVNAASETTDLTVKAALTLSDGAVDPELPDELTAESAESSTPASPGSPPTQPPSTHASSTAPSTRRSGAPSPRSVRRTCKSK
jgi:hypothetical protein